VGRRVRVATGAGVGSRRDTRGLPVHFPTYISIRKGDSSDPKLMVTSQELIGVLKEEYMQQQRRTEKFLKDEGIHQAITGKPSLIG